MVERPSIASPMTPRRSTAEYGPSRRRSVIDFFAVAMPQSMLGSCRELRECIGCTVRDARRNASISAAINRHVAACCSDGGAVNPKAPGPNRRGNHASRAVTKLLAGPATAETRNRAGELAADLLDS